MPKIEEVTKFEEIAKNLGLEIPSNFAILPQNFFEANASTEVFYNEEIQTIKKILDKAGLVDIYCLRNKVHIPFKSQKSAEWVAPIMFVSGLMLSENSNLISIALDIIAAYATDALKGIPKKKQRIKMDIVYEIDDNKKYVKISYEGEPEGIKELPKIMREIKKK